MPHPYNDSVFINYPFDPEYQPKLEAITFAVYRCGFYPESALSEDNALDNRLSKIEHLISKCKYGIHDISRVELNSQGYPRFNMPFEVGLFFGARKFGDSVQKSKNALIFEKIRHSYQSYFSDLSGVDIKAHNSDLNVILREIRNWLRTSSKRASIPGDLVIINDFTVFQAELPAILKSLGLSKDNLLFNDLCLIIEEFSLKISPSANH